MNERVKAALEAMPDEIRTALLAMSHSERAMTAENLRRPLEALPATSGAANKATRSSIEALAEWLALVGQDELEAEVDK